MFGGSLFEDHVSGGSGFRINWIFEGKGTSLLDCFTEERFRNNQEDVWMLKDHKMVVT